jgi:protein TonB
MISLHKGSDDVKTFYIQFTQMGEQTVQSPQPVGETERPRPRVTEPAREINEEKPLVKDPPVEDQEAVIRDNTIETHDVVKVASAPKPEPQPQSTQATQYQGGESPGKNVSSAGVTSSGWSGASGVIETAFGANGAPLFLRRHMPIYPMMAKKLGKEGKVVLRLFINEKGRLLNVDVVEPASYGFTESALEAVKMSTFTPAHENGVSIASKALLTIRFVLKKA